MSAPVLLVHGGAGTWSPEFAAACEEGIRSALHAGWQRLTGGGSALDAVEAATVALEDDETFNAGRGSCLTSDGRVGDSPIVGAGAYCDNRVGAVSVTGWGEAIVKLVLAKWAADRLSEGISAPDAARLAIDHLYARLGATGGLIALDPSGNYGV